ncbi:MAG: hypothetical protein IJA32_05650 [Lachnospiraceae bacterium]|nr:hypothetical protein [Lachnospiraceae bacterium]
MKWNQNNICIYGLGAYGLRTYFFLKEYGIETMCFGDRDERKCGYALEGVECRNYDEVICYEKDKWTIIVAVENSERLIEHFRNLGFQFCLSFKQMIRELQEKDISYQKKIYSPITDLDKIKKYKKNLEYVLTYGVQLEEVDNKDMQNILEDCIRRQGGVV